jgi:1,4-alpha-glucan branching enzyme
MESFLRRGASSDDLILVICNFTPVPRFGYQVGVPRLGRWKEILNSDAPAYGGTGVGNLGAVDAAEAPSHGRPYSLALTIPPLSALFFIDRAHRPA